MKTVPVSMEDKQKSYYKYFTEPMEPIAPEIMEFINRGPGDNQFAHRIQDRNDLFKPGYLPGEMGYWCLEDGTALMSNLLDMPGVTIEMFDWWSAWHPLDRLRYAIWNPEEHYDVRVLNIAHATDMSLSPIERARGSVHRIWEDIGLGQIDLMQLTFLNPEDVGYCPEQAGPGAYGHIAACGNGITLGNADMPDAPVFMTHFIRPTATGIELRSRFWFGYHIIDGKIVKVIPDGAVIPEIAPRALLIHSVKEMTRLSKLLPRIYPEEKDNW